MVRPPASRSRPGDTLQTFADRINGTDDIGVSASVINDKLVLISRESGSAGAITLGGTAAAGLGLATTQPGQDAAATINGLAVTSAGNSIKGAINGVTLNLAKEGATTITVGADNAASVTEAQKFVDAYNAVMKNVKLATSYDAATQTAGTLQGDQTMSGLASAMRNIAGSAVTSLAGGSYDSLAQIGITSSRDGTLTLDKNAFSAALAADPEAVADVFGRDDGVAGSGPADGIARQIQGFADTYSKDILSSRLTGFTASLGRMDEQDRQPRGADGPPGADPAGRSSRRWRRRSRSSGPRARTSRPSSPASDSTPAPPVHRNPIHTGTEEGHALC